MIRNPSRPSNMIHDFSRVPAPQIQRSSFSRDFTYKSTFNAGYLIPIFVDEMLPGDTFNVSATTLARMATPIYPVMDNLFADIQYFFVPNRLVWEHWEEFCGQQTNPGDSIDYTIPQQVSPAGGYAASSLQDYMGLPTALTGSNTFSHSALFTRAYNLIWNEWYRDENLQDSVTVDIGDGPDTVSNYVLLQRGKRKDYFTSALPWPQKGTAVTLPLGNTAPLVWPGNVEVDSDGNAFVLSTSAGGYGFKLNSGSWDAQTGSSSSTGAALYDGKGQGLRIDQADLEAGYANLAGATAATIDSIRLAFQIQRFLERDARGGTRYVELLYSHFKVISPDFRLQRPELLGTQSTRINITPIPQTSGTGSSGSTTPQGNLAGFGTFSHNGSGFRYSAVEHGVVLGLLSVRADLTYQQGVDRMWNRLTRYDYYWPVFAHLGEQAILNQEIYATGTGTDTEVFGYQEAYGEMRFKKSLITAEMRSSYVDSLDAWHLSQEFGSLPSLNPAFIVENPPMSRVEAVTGTDFILDVYFNFRAARPMPLYSVPGLVDHF